MIDARIEGLGDWWGEAFARFPRLLVQLGVALLLPLCLSNAAVQGPPAALQPYTRKSPDGHWALAVDPSQRDGSGPAKYLCTHDGKVAWGGEKPWTFHDAIVTDQGFAAGYSYSKGGLDFAEGDFHAVILSPDGTALLDEKHARKSSRFLHALPDPRCAGIFHHPVLDRIVFRIADPDINRRSEEWWGFSLPTARNVFRKQPRVPLPDENPGGFVLAVRAVRSTPLTLVQWSTFEGPKIGLEFGLFDADLKRLWNFTRPEEMMGPDNKATVKLLDLVYERGTLLDEPGDARFAIGLPMSREKHRFAIEGAAPAFTVRELGQESWSLSPETDSGARFQDLPAVRLKLTSSVDIAAPNADASAIRDIVAFDCATPRVLRMARSEKDGSFTLLRVDESGAVLLERHVNLPDQVPDLRPGFWPLTPNAWLATLSPYGVGAKTRAWRVDEETGVATALAAFDCPAIDAVAALGQGRFAVLATDRGTSTLSKSLRAFDAEGRTAWRIEEDDSDDPSALFSPEALAMTTTGSIAVVDAIRHTLQFFDRGGKFTRSIKLDKVWKRKTNYPSGVQPDLDGGVLVHDFDGHPPLYRMNGDGTVRAKLSPRFPDGKVVEGLTRNARVAPDGKLWATDDERLLRMDKHGVVDLQLGARAEVDVLGEPSATAIDVLGRALVQDGATGAVHVFDKSGKRLFVCRPEPSDFKDPNPIAHLAATRDGGVVAEREFGAGYVFFGSGGERVGAVTLQDHNQSLVYSPAGDVAYAGEFAKGFVQLGTDLAVRAKFERGPDGAWLEGSDPLAVAPDGAVAAVTSSRLNSGRQGALALFEKPDPKSGRLIELPEGSPGYCLALGPKWAVIWNYHSDVLLVQRTDGRLVRPIVGELGKDKTSWSLGFDPESGELLGLDVSARKLHRFALP